MVTNSTWQRLLITVVIVVVAVILTLLLLNKLGILQTRFTPPTAVPVSKLEMLPTPEGTLPPTAETFTASTPAKPSAITATKLSRSLATAALPVPTIPPNPNPQTASIRRAYSGYRLPLPDGSVFTVPAGMMITISMGAVSVGQQVTNCMSANDAMFTWQDAIERINAGLSTTMISGNVSCRIEMPQPDGLQVWAPGQCLRLIVNTGGAGRPNPAIFSDMFVTDASCAWQKTHDKDGTNQ